MQRALFPRDIHRELTRTEHGGQSRRGRRKLARPVSTRRPMHLVLASPRARGVWSLKKHDRAVRDTLRLSARRHRIRVYEFANVGSHLHLLVRTRSRDGFQSFLRSFAGLVARVVTGARKGRPSGRFWGELAWSRVVAWGRDFAALRHYVVRNQIEARAGAAVRRALEHGPPIRAG